MFPALLDSREATSQADMLACPFGDCRGGKYPTPWGELAKKAEKNID